MIQKHTSYQNVNNAYQNLDLTSDDTLMRQFNIVSAGLHNFLPQLNGCDHESVFREILLHQQLSSIEQASFDALDLVEDKEAHREALQFLKANPSIICTYHIGSYRLINLLLARNDIPFSLVVAGKVAATQGDTFKRIAEELSVPENFSLINAESAGAAFLMIKALKQGRSIVVYLDGNTGTGQQTQLNENCCSIDFLGQAITVRTGVGYLSHAATVPVVPVLCFRKSLRKIAFRFFDPVFPDLKMERNIYARNLLQDLYNIAGTYIAKYPGQWEAWLYLYKVTVIKKSKWNSVDRFFIHSTGELAFNKDRFGLFKVHQDSYIFDKSNYLSYKIARSLYDVLIGALDKTLKRDCIDVLLLQDLYKKGVLIAA